MLNVGLAGDAPSEVRSRPFSADDIEADATLDVRGLWCPLPPLKTLGTLSKMKTGQVLEVLGTNPIGNKMAPWLAERLGNQLLGTVKDAGGFLHLYFRKA